MKVAGKIVTEMVMEHINLLMVESMLVDGLIVNLKVKVFIHSLTAIVMNAATKII